MNAYLGKFKEREMEDAAVLTLEKLNYTYHGGQLWKPPIGQKPDWVDEDKAVQARELDGSGAVEWADGLPPVGTVCEYENYTMGEWRKGEVIAHYKNVIVIADCDSGFEGVYKHQVRPIKSEKDIEEIYQIIYAVDDYRTAAEAIYEQGYRKQES